MEFLISLLTDPKVLSLLSLPTICMLVLAYALYKMFQKYDALQELRIKETKEMNHEYVQLSQDLNKTLDGVLKVVASKNSNGGGK